MSLTCETAKRLNLVEFLEKNYRYSFMSKGKSYRGVSPFINEQNNGFTVSYKHEHWLFHDYASGYCGSIIDFVIYKEGLSGVPEALSFIENHSSKMNGMPKEPSAVIAYDVAYIYEKIRSNPTDEIQQYLRNRSIPQSLISHFEGQGALCSNRVDTKIYCSFVIRDPEGKIQCIDNHAIGQREKFILGRKGVFTLDWQQLQRSKTIFVCESIIDYLSILAMNGDQIPGMALLGTSLMAAPTLFDKADHIISGFDNDEGGRDGLRRFRHLFGSCRFSSFMMDGCKDANEYLQKNPGKRLEYSLKKLDIDEKCTIALSVNKSSRELGEEYGVHHSTINEIQNECKQVLYDHLGNKQTGRPAKLQASESAIVSETEIAELKKKCALQELQIDYLKLQLKFSHNRLEEATGSKKAVKVQLKKKEKESVIEVIMNHRSTYPDILEKERLKIIEMTPQTVIYLEKSIAERKERESSIPEEDIMAAVSQIVQYPCLGGVKGSLKLIEDKRALIGETMYDEVKEESSNYMEEEYQRRQRESEIATNSKERQDAVVPFVKPVPLKPHDVWSIDYMFIMILGFKFAVCVIYDLYAQYYCALGVDETIGGEFARLTFEEAEENTGHIPSLAQLSDNDATFVNGEFYNYLEKLAINYVRIPKGEPWWNGELESGNRDLRHWILQEALKGVVQKVELTKRGRSREEVLQYVKECCQKVRMLLNEEIPRVKFKTTPQNVCDNRVEERQAAQEKFKETKKEERRSRMEEIKSGTLKTRGKTLIEKAKSALKKLVGKMSDDELFVANELLHKRYLSIIY